MRVLTAEQMMRFDRWASTELGLPEMVLMENAALGVTDALQARFPVARRVFVACGPGNNGADGWAVARQLATRGVEVTCLQAGDVPEGSALELQRRIALELGVQSVDGPPAPGSADVVVDALFGTGLSRPLAGHLAELALGLDGAAAPVVSVDLPSGLDASLTRPIGPSVKATLTVTFARPKLAHVAFPSAGRCGELVVADLGIRYRDVGHGPWHNLILEADVGRLLPVRPEDGHKGTFGHLLVVAGSRGMEGAALLSTRAGIRGGAGLVTLAVPGGASRVGDLSAESMTLAVGAPDADCFVASDAPALEAAAEERSALAVGPGVGRAGGTLDALRRLLDRCTLPAVVDADGLRCFETPEQAGAGSPRVLTPHPGELARLLSRSTESVQEDRPGAAREAAARSGCVVVLKGRSSLVAEPGGELWINPTGGPELATGGTGDVLTGLVGALLAQGMEALDAAIAAAWIHGRAGDRLVEGGPRLGHGAGALLDELPAAMEECLRCRDAEMGHV